MFKHLSPAQLRLCHPRAATSAGSEQERERDRAETLHREGPVLIRSELERIRPEPVPDTLLNRVCQAVDVLLGRGQVFVERRQRP